MPEIPMRMQWILHGPGSARFTWEVGEDKIEIGTTYLSDGFASLISMAIDLSLGARATFATLVGEPGGHRIFCSGASEQVFIQVVRFKDVTSPDTWWKDATPRWYGRVLVSDVINCARSMAADVLEKHSAAEYRKEWGIPFPIEAYKKLQQAGKGE